MDVRDPVPFTTLATLRRTYERCFVYLMLAGVAALTEFAIVAYDGEPYRFIAAGAIVTVLAALTAAIAAPIIARFAGEERGRNRLSVRWCVRAISLGAVACLPLAINRAVCVWTVGHR